MPRKITCSLFWNPSHLLISQACVGLEIRWCRQGNNAQVPEKEATQLTLDPQHFSGPNHYQYH
jgi:hypothetical protein